MVKLPVLSVAAPMCTWLQKSYRMNGAFLHRIYGQSFQHSIPWLDCILMAKRSLTYGSFRPWNQIWKCYFHQNQSKTNKIDQWQSPRRKWWDVFSKEDMGSISMWLWRYWYVQQNFVANVLLLNRLYLYDYCIPHSRIRHYFYSNLYGCTPRGPRGVKNQIYFFTNKTVEFLR